MKIATAFLFTFFLALVASFLLTGIPQDAVRAYRMCEKGDRGRCFMYNQTVRHEGVLMALEKYGIEPNK